MFNKVIRSPWVVIGTSIVIIMFTALGDNILGPFYPEEADERHVSQSNYGFVIGAFELAAMLFSLPLGIFMSSMDIRLVFMSGMVLLGGSSVLFGFLQYIYDPQPFITLSFAIRIIQSIGQIAVNVAVVCILQIKYPHMASSVTAWAETGFGVGMIIGPFIGGILYDIGGFALPFVFLGSILILSIIPGVVLLTIENQKASEHGKGSLGRTWDILKLPMVWVGVLGNAIGVTCGGSFLQSTLEPHLRSFHLSGTFVGLIFFLNGLGYICTNPIWGMLCDKGVSPHFLMIIAGILIVVGLGMLGPMPWTGFHPKLSLVVTGLVLTGIGTGGNFIPSLAQIIESCREKNIPYNNHTKGVITGLWLAAFNIGGFVGPSFGGLICDYVGFQMLCFIAMCINFGFIILCIPFTIKDFLKRKKYAQIKNTETTRLVVAESAL